MGVMSSIRLGFRANTDRRRPPNGVEIPQHESVRASASGPSVVSWSGMLWPPHYMLQCTLAGFYTCPIPIVFCSLCEQCEMPRNVLKRCDDCDGGCRGRGNGARMPRNATKRIRVADYVCHLNAYFEARTTEQNSAIVWSFYCSGWWVVRDECANGVYIATALLTLGHTKKRALGGSLLAVNN